MMPLRKLFLGSVIVLLLISGVFTVDGWGVSYTPNYICALKGSTVTMSCRYKYPSGYKLEKAFWSTELVTNVSEPPDLASDPAYTNRIQYIGDKRTDCTLRLHDVTEQDQRSYYFRFITDKPEGKYQGKDGVLLSVTEPISVEVPENVVTGTAVTLTCKTTCTPTYQTFTWYKNGQKLNRNYKWLNLVSVSREKAESYSCAVGDLQSPAVTLNVQYPPERVSASISPSAEIMEGSSVTLTCSADANPPVQDCKLYKGSSFKGDGSIHTMSSVSSEDSGDYKCKCSYKSQEKYSAAVTLTVLYPPKTVRVSISPSGEKVEGSLETLTCSSDANPPVQSYTWFKEGGDSPVGSGQSYNVLQAGPYYCVAQNKYGNRTAAALSVALNGDKSAVLYAVLGLVAVCLIAIIVGFFIWRRRRRNSADETKPSQNVYSNVEMRTSTNNQASDQGPSNHDEVEYASVLNQAPNKPRKVNSSPAIDSGSGLTDEFLYDTVQPHSERVAEKPKDDPQYSSIMFTHSGAASRSAAVRTEDLSVIYSSVK